MTIDMRAFWCSIKMVFVGWEAQEYKYLFVCFEVEYFA